MHRSPAEDQTFEAVTRFDDARLPELFCGLDKKRDEGPIRYPVACSPQAWSVAALFGILQAILGIRINALDKTIILDKPVLPEYLKSLTINDLRIDKSTTCINFKRHFQDVGVIGPRKLDGWRLTINK